ncbi:hypothetical protein B0T17DRAFT_546785 [Bombardia bombarda]|uniref:Secreted protein n=1 Tax=Bombardia bombarda TaxID=252184 RepID=A0AA39TZX8_9PEZI|nr:hypothetical protein B0T17DRAFT_546785 [Bombardia bombarda]
MAKSFLALSCLWFGDAPSVVGDGQQAVSISFPATYCVNTSTCFGPDGAAGASRRPSAHLPRSQHPFTINHTQCSTQVPSVLW